MACLCIKLALGFGTCFVAPLQAWQCLCIEQALALTLHNVPCHQSCGTNSGHPAWLSCTPSWPASHQITCTGLSSRARTAATRPTQVPVTCLLAGPATRLWCVRDHLLFNCLFVVEFSPVHCQVAAGHELCDVEDAADCFWILHEGELSVQSMTGQV